jgi:hypothetical protein
MTDEDKLIEDFTRIIKEHGKVTIHSYRPMKDCAEAGFWYTAGVGAAIFVGLIMSKVIDAGIELIEGWL